ncbi:MAG TPA: FtsX-like permease family protein [Actinomycetota bacterium]|nr:FtsX-like permease family protein [Actinomycetota bacterium]
MTPGAALNAGVVAGVLLLIVAWQVTRRPVERRLALRDATRRPGETLLVIAGSLLGTALVTGSFIVGDTLDSSIKASAWTQLGPVDEVVAVPDLARGAEVARAVEAIDDSRIDGVETMVSAPASVATTGARRAEPDARLLELDFTSARSFGGDPSVTGVSGATPGPGETVVTEDLAATLEVGAGDVVVAYLYGRRVPLEVARVVPQEGLAGFWLGFESSSPNAFVAPGTIARAARARPPAGAVPPTTYVLVSNRGGVEDGVALAGAVVGLVEERVGDGLRVEPVKRDLLDAAEEAGSEFGNLFLNIGMFAMLAGVLLLVNIFVMLSEERKAQLGTLRAVGMRRADLVRVFAIEGAIYSLAAGVLGAVVGIGVGWAIVTLAAPIFGGIGDFSLDLRFAVEPASIVGGFFIGIVVSLSTILATSVRISRVNIIRAIRDLPEPRREGPRRRTKVVFAVVAAIAAAWFLTSLSDRDAWAAALLGPPIAAFALVPLAGRAERRRRAVLAASTGALLWGIFGNRVTGGRFFDAGELGAFVIQGVLLTFAAVVLLSQLQENLADPIRRVAARNLSLRLGVAYPMARRFRTALTLGMYSLVVFTMTFVSVLSNVFGGQVDNATAQEAGGYDVLVTASASNPPAPDALAATEGVESVAALTHGQALFRPRTLPQPVPWPATGIGRDFVAGGPPALDELPERFDDERAAWAELLRDPDAMIVPAFFLESEGGPPSGLVRVGDVVTMIDPVTGKESRRRVIAFANQDFAFSGAYMSRSSLRDALGASAAPARFYLRTGSEADVHEVATRLQGRFVANGVEADAIRSIVEDNLSSSLQFFRLMQAYLALGLVVGVAGLGVVMVRAVRDRRREIGVLRALGFLPRRVRSAFLLESGFVAFEGIVVGSVLALLTSSQLVNNGDFGEGVRFVVPWAQVVRLCAGALVASLVAVGWPARQASRIAPAVALRIGD